MVVMTIVFALTTLAHSNVFVKQDLLETVWHASILMNVTRTSRLVMEKPLVRTPMAHIIVLVGKVTMVMAGIVRVTNILLTSPTTLFQSTHTHIHTHIHI